MRSRVYILVDATLSLLLSSNGDEMGEETTVSIEDRFSQRTSWLATGKHTTWEL